MPWSWVIGAAVDAIVGVVEGRIPIEFVNPILSNS